MIDKDSLRVLFWVASSRRDLRRFPVSVRRAIGYALWCAQCGDRHVDAKVLKGFGGAGVLEIVTDYDGNTFRTVYTVKFAGTVYVLHAFQKKSKKGTATPRAEMELVRSRFRIAEQHYARWRSQQKNATKDR